MRLGFLFIILFSLKGLLLSQNADNYVLENVSYLDFEEGAFIKGHLLIEEGIIKKINEEKISLKDFKVIDADNKFLIPGLIDAHIHLFQSGGIYTRPDFVAKMRSDYQSMFENNPNLDCELLDRVVYGNTVIDKERITGLKNREPLEALAIYKIENDKIAKVYFVR